jgi:hypothetical protein
MLGGYHICAEDFTSLALSEQGKLYCPERINNNLNKVTQVWKDDRSVEKRLAQ